MRHRLRYIVVGIIACLVSSLFVLMIVEYRFLRTQTFQMVQLQQEYRNYLQSVKSIVDDYAKTKERLVLLEEINKGEKKKSEYVAHQLTYDTPFPEGVRVFSSDDSDLEAQDAFLVVNRELEYLKDVNKAHFKEIGLENLVAYDDNGVWGDYTEQMLARKEQIVKSTRKRRSSQRAIKSKQPTLMASTKNYTKDMVFSWPIDRAHFWLSSLYGPRKKRNGSIGFHYGIDMAAVKGTSVMAAAPGIVRQACYAKGYGNTILIEHSRKYKTRYAHLKSIFVHVGQDIARGALIGAVGDTGSVRSAFGGDPSHLHLELYVFDKKVNPMHFLA